MGFWNSARRNRRSATSVIRSLFSYDVASKFDCVFHGVALCVIIEIGKNVFAAGELLFDPAGLRFQLLG